MASLSDFLIKILQVNVQLGWLFYRSIFKSNDKNNNNKFWSR